MKKILALLLAFALLACTFAACGEEKPTETEAPSGTAAPSATVAPSETEAPSTEAPSTEAPSTEAPSTEAPSTEAPSTEAPSTEAPSTEAPSTEAPSTEAPSTEAPSAEAPSTEAPSAEAPSTEAPSTEAPSAEAPSTEAPSAEAPSTEAPSTEAPSTEAPSTDEGGEEGPGLDEYENAVLWHTPVLDGVLDEEYYSSYNFAVEQFSNLQAGVEDPNAYSNRSHVYVLWDGEYVYFAVELYDDDMLAREPEYLVWVDEIGDINPWCNDVAEIWYSFEGTVPEKGGVKKLCYDAYGQGEGPFSSVGEGIYSNHFEQSAAAAKLELGYDPEDEEGFCDRSVIEFKIPAKTEIGDELAEGDPIYFAVQINDIKEATPEELMAAGYNPINFTPNPDDMEGIGSGYTYTYGRASGFYPLDGELNGYSMGTLTTFTPASLAE